MSKREVGLLRLLQQPYSFGLDNPLTGTRRNIVAVDNATVVLTADQCGATVLLGGSGAGTATLPSVENGVWFNFMVISAHQHVINGGASVMQGCIHHNTNATTTARVAASNESSLTLHGSNAAIGDAVRIVSNGTNWYVDGLTNDVPVFA